MKYLGSKVLETNRLILKAQSPQEQKRLWEILMIPEVNRYFLTVPVKFRDKLKDWNIQENYYEEDMKHANDKDVFRWSIFLKETGECIGRISCHEGHDEDENINNPNIRGVGWIIDPKYQGNGYGTEVIATMKTLLGNKLQIYIEGKAEGSGALGYEMNDEMYTFNFGSDGNIYLFANAIFHKDTYQQNLSAKRAKAFG